MLYQLPQPQPPASLHGPLIRALLARHPEITLAYVRTEQGELKIHAHTEIAKTEPATIKANHLPETPIVWHKSPPLHTLIAAPDPKAPRTVHTACQNAPIPSGTQIQPKGKPWVGTAGSPIRFKTPDGITRWGIITNAHVSGTPANEDQRKLHQPTDRFPQFARTTVFAYPEHGKTNTLDVALADSKIGEFHTTAWAILGIGTPNPNWTNATPGTPAIKSGRTTGVTKAQCTATGGVARIDYGGMIADFADLDVFDDAPGFSAGGDSGSLILHEQTLQPLSLLFAGGGNTTLAIPIRNVAKAITIAFQP